MRFIYFEYPVDMFDCSSFTVCLETWAKTCSNRLDILIQFCYTMKTLVTEECSKNKFPNYLECIIVWHRRDLACYVSTLHLPQNEQYR
jgi:hypothetical protein